jgi:hypothetical protein
MRKKSLLPSGHTREIKSPAWIIKGRQDGWMDELLLDELALVRAALLSISRACLLPFSAASTQYFPRKNQLGSCATLSLFRS